MNQAVSTTDLSLPELCRWTLGYAWHRWFALAGVVFTMLLKIGLDLLKPWPMVFLIDYVLQGKITSAIFPRIAESLPGDSSPTHLVGWSVGATVLIFLLSWATSLASTYASISLGQRMVYDLAADLFARLQQLSLHFHSRKSVGDSIRRVTADCACVSIIVKDALLPVAAATASLITMFLVMWRVDSTLTLLAVAVVPYMALVFRAYAKPMTDRSYQQQEAEGRIYDVAERTFSAMPAVQAFGREELNDLQFRQATNDTVTATLALTRVQMQFKVLIGLATAVGTAGILWIGARHALNDQLSIGSILLFLSYLGMLYGPLESVMYSTSAIQGAAGSAKRVREILQTAAQVTDKPGVLPLAAARGHVRFDNVTFGYEENRPILRNISLEVKPGETIAVVGATGAGKSTLAGMIPRFFDPWEGRVLLDDRDLRDVQLKSLRNQVALVLQDPFLFPLTLAENIAYGRPSATLAEIETAARAANAHDFIAKLPRGYHTIIGERGATLSGGERQRISIARALLKNAPILILDEPTSALDAETERTLLEALGRLTAGRTTFIIAHRLSTVRRASRVVVLEQGRIAENGTHGELLARKGIYASYCRLQFGDQEATTEKNV